MARRSGELSSTVAGLDVYNNANQNIGTIKDVYREACLRRRWRWERCWAGVLGHAFMA
jgi:hypothetical protein